jgi:hypothetical protein
MESICSLREWFSRIFFSFKKLEKEELMTIALMMDMQHINTNQLKNFSIFVAIEVDGNVFLPSISIFSFVTFIFCYIYMIRHN